MRTAGDIASELEATEVLKAIGEELADVREICGFCARHYGGTCGVHTISVGSCDVCKQTRGTSPITDYHFHPMVNVRYIWD